MLPGALQHDALSRARRTSHAAVGVIRTDRLLLRPARPDDLLPLHSIFSDTGAMRYWSHPAHEDLEPTRRFLEGFMTEDAKNRFEYIVEFDGTCIGKAGMWARPEIGYILHPDHWGKGFAYEALSAVLPRIFERHEDLEHLTAECDPRNAASVKLLEKLGFRQTGLIEKNFLYGETEWCDTAYFRLDRPN
ncbi:GNAT family N-acetyltransferase [Ruegeria sp. HKCCD8929]|uniref:GNAT family N-acetyltransferase n=1 Tax=Ruegeria sp. HKCCD8929 TaxID=2683006 RepID=UPI001488A6B8|nr:GNAT family N-acetyltransferase [Ruegeria sp. HKCCD8929]